MISTNWKQFTLWLAPGLFAGQIPSLSLQPLAHISRWVPGTKYPVGLPAYLQACRHGCTIKATTRLTFFLFIFTSMNDYIVVNTRFIRMPHDRERKREKKERWWCWWWRRLLCWRWWEWWSWWRWWWLRKDNDFSTFFFFFFLFFFAGK